MPVFRVVTFFLLTLLVTAAAGAQAAPVGASALIGARVANPEGERLATVRDLAVDLRAGLVSYAILELEDSTVTRTQMRSVPLQALKPGLAPDQLVLDSGADAKWRAADRPLAEPDERLIRATSMLGMEVDHPSGADYGTITDVILDLDTARVQEAVVRLKAGTGDETRRIPLHALRFPAGHSIALVTLEEQPEKAPQSEPRPMKASALIGMEVRSAGTGATGRIDDLVVDIHNNRVHYAVLDMERQLHTEPLGDLQFPAGEDHALLIDPDPSPVDPRSGMILVRASTLLGWEVESDPGRDLGRLTDLVVDPASGTVRFAVLRLHENGYLHAVPTDAFELHALRENLVLDIDPSQLQPGQAFTREALASALAQGDYLKQLASSADALTPDASAATGASRAPGSDEMFRKLDRNGDGVLSDAELDRRASERRNWIALDLDRDGRITRREFTGVRAE